MSTALNVAKIGMIKRDFQALLVLCKNITFINGFTFQVDVHVLKELLKISCKVENKTRFKECS